MINLFEYQNKAPLSEDFNGLEAFLDDIWRQREKTGFYYGKEETEEQIEAQRFVQFLHKTGEIKSNKYVGVIHYEGQKINLLPKIFYDEGRPASDEQVRAAHQHMLWWLSYCRKIRFPSYQTSLDTAKSDFFEVLIYLFAKYTRSLLSHSIYLQYEEARREMAYVRGRLDVTRYINQNLSRGRWQKVNCIFDPFVIDNRFNQIIKYVARMLLQQTGSENSKKYLREVLFTLDEVSDQPATAEECAAIQFNPAFAEFETVRDYCRLFLAHTVSLDYNNELKLFAFLLPMEYVFEDFIFGFIEREVPEMKAQSQASAIKLDEEKTFTLKPDLIIQKDDNRLIADTKYKMVYTNADDPKKGISESDLYQVLAYAVRHKIDKVALLYPETFRNYEQQPTAFTIRDEFTEHTRVNITAWQLPLINHKLMAGEVPEAQMLHDLFKTTGERLKQRLGKLIVV